MPILKEAHFLKSKNECRQIPWYAVEGGFASPLYLSLDFHDKLTKLAAELETGKVKVTLYYYDKHNPQDCELVKLDEVVDVWRNKDDRYRIMSKRSKLAQGMNLLDLLDRAAEPWREKKRSLNR